MNQSTSAVSPVHLLSAGPFGRAVVRNLKSLRGDVVDTDVSNNLFPLPSTWPASRLLALVSWRPVMELSEMLNEISHERRIPLIPAIQDLTAIRIGPIILPGRGPCWNCWIARWRQHSGWTHERTSLSRHYATHPEAGPAGYLESFAAMTACRLSQVIASVDSNEARAGSIWQVEMLTGETSTAFVIGVHDCPCCGLRRPKSTRSVAELQTSLAYLWSQP
jgi:bacteriocin biosynthesis cyclodehydratase domain-containing protein